MPTDPVPGPARRTTPLPARPDGPLVLELLAAHVVAAVAAPTLVRWMGRRAFLVLALAPASALVWALSWTGAVMAGDGPVTVTRWVPALGLELAFRLDTLSWLMVVLVGGVGALVLIYSSAYFSASAGGLGRFGGVLVAFAGAMLGLVVADDLLLLYVFWELTTVFSYLLIGHYFDRKASRRAAMQAIVLTTAGGLAMLVGMILVADAAGTSRISQILADPPTGTLVTVGVVAMLAGAVTKSALIPFHFWLPAAMAAPTPVSAYLHAAAMVKAGVYLVARLAPGFSDLLAWQVVVLGLGAGTLLVGGYRALRQYDLKLILAFGTVSQLGLIILLVGHGDRAVALAGVAMLGAHAMFKAALFLAVGVVDAATGTRDLRRLNGVGRELPVTAAVAGLAVASMIGLPPFAGYVAKEAALEGLLHAATDPAGVAVLVAMLIGSALTVAYGLRLWWGAFATKSSVEAVVPDPEPPAPLTITHPSWTLVYPAALLALLGLVVALVPIGESLLEPHAAQLPGEAGHLTLWAGFGPVLYMTLGVLAVGIALFVWRGPVARFQARRSFPLDADVVYRRTMRKLDDVAADVTARTQRGSLPLYLGIVVVVFLSLVIAAYSRGGGIALRPLRLWDQPAQALAGALAVVTVVLAARARRRLKAVILVGLSGYAVAGLYLLHGSPDLALTQVLVETVSVVVFVLVLRRLPPHFTRRPLESSRWLRLAAGIAAGLAVAVLGLTVPGTRVHEPVSVSFPEEAYTYGGGRNIVNVTLVDIRAWDTMGEISVLLVAATGVASLIFLRRRSGDILRAERMPPKSPVWATAGDDPMQALRRWSPTPDAQSSARVPEPSEEQRRGTDTRARVWLRAVPTLDPQRRSVVFEVVTRVLFHPMIVFALFLLFAGHNNPGGGFVAGLVVGIALTVRYLAGGRYELGEAAPVHPGLLLGAGLFLSAGVGLVAGIFGGSILQSVILDLHLPVFGEVHLVTSVFFDIGVFLVVVGLVLDILRSLGAEVDRQGEEAGYADEGGGEIEDLPEPAATTRGAGAASGEGSADARGVTP